jgi:pullulanase
MKYKFKPLMLGTVIAVSTLLTACGGDEAQPEVTDVFKEVGLWCKSPEIVQIASADSYPLSETEIAGVNAAIEVVKAEAKALAGDSWDETEWEAGFKLKDLDLYSILGLTLEEKARQVIAKQEARAFKVEQGQDVIYGDDFESWFETWFSAIPPANYLGASQRIERSANKTTAAMDGNEICYTPPLSCPNYKVIDETGTYECIIPELNPILDAPAPEVSAGAGQAVAFYRHEDHVEGADNASLYENVVVHTWNNDDCTAYADDSVSPQWGQSPSGATSAIDDNYGIYWIFTLVDEPSLCANIIFNDTVSGKKISDNDLTMPLGGTGEVVLHNLNKNAYAHDDFSANGLDGLVLINQHPYFGAESASGLKACGWGLAADASGEQCLGQSLVCPENTVAVGVATVDIASKCVALFDPENTTLFIKGGFNGWSATDDAKFAYTNNGQYQLNYLNDTECEVVAPTDDSEGEDCLVNHQFKVADEAWSEPASFGSIKGGDQSGVGQTIIMTVGSGVGQNMAVTFAEDKIYQFLVNAENTSAVELTINEVPVDAFPSLTIAGETVALNYSSDGNYVVRRALMAESYSFTIADEATDFVVGANDADNVITASTVFALANGGGALSFTSASAAEYDFVLNLSDPQAPSLEIKPALPFGSDAVFIRGSVNGWSTPAADEVKWNADKQSYSVIYGLEAGGNHAFKFADASWGVVNLGFNEVTISDAADAIAVTDDGGNMRVSVPKSTSYQFEVIFDSADPVVKVSEAPLYLRGSITDWGASETNQLMFAANDAGNSAETSHTYSIEVAISNAGEFKVADEGWGGSFGYNYGVEVADTKVELGVALELVQSNNNIKIDFPAGTYIFAFEDGVTKTMTVTAK